MLDEAKKALNESEKLGLRTRYSNFKTMLREYFTDIYKQIFDEKGDKL